MSNNINLALQEEIRDFRNNNFIIQENINSYKNYINFIESLVDINDISSWESGQYGFYKNNNDEFTNVDISDSQTAYIQKTFKNVIQIDFDYRVSSEEDYDFFNIYINGTRVISVSGETNYTHYTKTFDTPATVTIKFEYTKDSSESSGRDAGYFKNLALKMLLKTNGLLLQEEIKSYPCIKKELQEIIENYKNIKNNILYEVKYYKNNKNEISNIFKPYKNKVFFSYNRLGRQMNIPVKRIIIKNFEG